MVAGVPSMAAVLPILFLVIPVVHSLTCERADDICVLQNTTTICDPCEGTICPAEKMCVSDKHLCTTNCECSNPFTYEAENGTCVDVCTPDPCHGHPCVLDADSPSKYTCNCTADYDGQHCQMVHDYCLDEHPPTCPMGPFACEMISPGQYSCGCAPGHFLNRTSDMCVQVQQRINLNISFHQTPYSELYNNHSTTEYSTALTAIEDAMSELYGVQLISVLVHNFTEGSLVVHLTVLLGMASNDPAQHVTALKKYIMDCDSPTPIGRCFPALGPPHLAYDAIESHDERCMDVRCPVNTKCESRTHPICVCEDGFASNRTIVDLSGRIVQECIDIDECLSSPCSTGECINIPGSFWCATPCSNVSCPGYSECVPTGSSFVCSCPWMYSSPDCVFPWNLIHLIFTIIFLVLLLAFASFYVFRSSRFRVYAVSK